LGKDEKVVKTVRVAHLIATNFFGGPERQILTHAKHVAQHGVHALIISFQEFGQKNQLLAAASREGVPNLALKARSPFHPGSVHELYGLLRARQIKLLVTHGYKSNVVGRIASWAAGVPEIAVSRGWTAENGRIQLYEKIDRAFLRLADAVVAVSDGQRQKILACGGRPDKVRVIHNAIDLATYPGPAEKSVRSELGIPQDAILVATAGRLSPEKNHLGLVEAAKHVLAKMPDVYFVVFGEGFLRPELEKAVAARGIGNRFFLPGFRSDVRSLLHEIDIFVLPSHTEGLPNVVLEAFACSKPVVATRVGGTPEVVQQDENGFLVPAGEMGQLAEGILRLAADPQLRGKMGDNGFEHVLAAFGYPGQTDAYVDVYSELLGKDVRLAEAEA
jgi:glycosyltransferase involved in cell wall biosynthesis